MNPNFDLGQLITMGTVVFAAGGAWIRLRAVERQMESNTKQMESNAREREYMTRCVLELFFRLGIDPPARDA